MPLHACWVEATRRTHDFESMSKWETRVGRVLKWVRLDSIKKKIVTLAVMATLLPTLATALVSYTQNKRAQTARADEELQGVATQAAREVDLWIRDRFYDIGVFGVSFEVSENLVRLNTGSQAVQADAEARLGDYVSAVLERFPDYVSLVVLDAEGRQVAQGGMAPEGTEATSEFDRAHRVEETQLGKPRWDSKQNSVVAPLVEPVLTTDGLFRLGTLVAQLDFGALSTMLERSAPGESGLAHLVTQSGDVITASEAPAESVGEAFGGDAMAALAANPREIIDYEGLNGTVMLGTIQPVQGSDWAVVTEITQAEAYGPVARLRNLTMAIVVGLMVVMGALAYLVSQIVIRPLERLTHGAAVVADGDLSVDLPVTGSGEVAYLTKVFNDMVGRLRTSRQALDEAHGQLVQRNGELAKLSVTDELTGLFNRRHGMESFTEELARAQRTDEPMSVLMLDVDHFKQFNDTYGHQEGDTVLRGVARAIQQGTRGVDVTSRYGGEEFMVMLPECGATGAMEAGRRILERLSREDFTGGPITMSIGAAVYPEHGVTPEALIGVADAALYQAKGNGRNRVILGEGVDVPAESGYSREMTPRQNPTDEHPSEDELARVS